MEAFDSLRLQGLLSRARKAGATTRAYQFSLSYQRTIDPRLPANLLADSADWLLRIAPPPTVAAPPTLAPASKLPLLLDRFVSGGCVATVLEQCFIAGSVALSATVAGTPQPAAAALLEKEPEKDGAESDQHKPAEWHMRLTQPADSATAPPCSAPRLLSPALVVPTPPPAPADLRFDAPDLEAELRGEPSQQSLIALYRAAEQGQTDGVTLQTLAAACAPAPLVPLLKQLESRWLVVRVAAFDHHRFVARQHARPWCIVCPPAPVAVVRPWLRQDGQVQRSFLDTLHTRIIATIARAPGLSLVRLLVSFFLSFSFSIHVTEYCHRTRYASNCNPRLHRSTFLTWWTRSAPLI